MRTLHARRITFQQRSPIKRLCTPTDSADCSRHARTVAITENLQAAAAAAAAAAAETETAASKKVAAWIRRRR